MQSLSCEGKITSDSHRDGRPVAVYYSEAAVRSDSPLLFRCMYYQEPAGFDGVRLYAKMETS